MTHVYDYFVSRLLIEELRKTLVSLWQGTKAISPEALFCVIWEVVPRFRYVCLCNSRYMNERSWQLYNSVLFGKLYTVLVCVTVNLSLLAHMSEAQVSFTEPISSVVVFRRRSYVNISLKRLLLQFSSDFVQTVFTALETGLEWPNWMNQKLKKNIYKFWIIINHFNLLLLQIFS